MNRSLHSNPRPPAKHWLVRKHIAKGLVGHTVQLLVDAHTIVHGVVTSVLTKAGTPKLIVGGTGYDLNQILTTVPASLAQPFQSH